MSYLFKLPIGDWSDDGHGKCEWFIVQANKPLPDIFKAYWAAVEKLGINIGDEVCSDYEDSNITEEMYKRLQELGWKKEKKELNKSLYMGPDCMADLILWFLKEGDAELELELKEDEVPGFISWNDPSGKCELPQFGYGLFD